MNRHCLTLAAVCSLTALLAGGSSAPERAPGLKFDGRWWLTIGLPERTGFVDGFRDCYEYELKGPDQFSYGTVAYTSAITDFYQRGTSAERAMLVTAVLRTFKDTAGLKLTVPGAKQPKEPHGGRDGLYWMQLSVAGQDAQLGFVEGYLACHSGLNSDRGGRFSKTAAEYVTSISEWYRFDRETGDIDMGRQPTSIADVLFRFRDRNGTGR